MPMIIGGLLCTLGAIGCALATLIWFLIAFRVVQGFGGGEVVRIRMFVGDVLTAALSGFTMMANIANSSSVLQEQKGLQPMPFALFFATTALAQVLLSVVNAKIVGRFRPRTLIGFGLASPARFSRISSFARPSAGRTIDTAPTD
jgi:MFS family permease